MGYDIRDLRYIALRFTTPFGAAAVKEVLDSGAVETYRDIWDGDTASLKAIEEDTSLSEATRNAARGARSAVSKAQAACEMYVREVERLSMHVISVLDEDYPYAWMTLPGMPKVFFAKGCRNILSDVFSCGAAAVVGSRHPGSYSLYATGQMVKALTEKGIIIVSGMALGIDREAHITSLDNGGKTIGIMPAGLDIVYPYQNSDIYERISETGILISEMPPGQNVVRQYFPARNRLIAAISDVCMVMEAGEHSGTLHTASFAASMGKQLFVLPNNIYAENSIGALRLIKDGADVLIDPEEVIEHIGAQVGIRLFESGLAAGTDEKEDLLKRAKESPESLTKEERKSLILHELSVKDLDMGSLMLVLPFDYQSMTECLTELEITGRIHPRGGKYSLTFSGN